MTTTFDPLVDVWTLLYAAPGETYPAGGAITVTKDAPSGDTVLVATSSVIPPGGVWGLRIRNGSETVRVYLGEYLSGAPANSIKVDVPTVPISILLAYTDEDKLVTGSYSLDGYWWTKLPTTVTMAAAPTHAELFYEQFSASISSNVTFSRFRVLPGTLPLPYQSESKTFAPIGAGPDVQPPALTPSQMKVVHALVGAQFGDLEFDIGKSVRWTQWFTDDVFITDVNYGTQRFWIIDWTESFPEVNFKTVGGVNFFEDPVAFRKRQFADAEKFAFDNPYSLVFDNEDWVLFVDAHEGMSVDNTPPYPPDYEFDLFRSYVAREIREAIEAGKDRLVLPFFAFVRHDDIQNVQYDWQPGQPEGGPKVTQAIGVPYYIPYQGLTRLVKVSALRNLAFDWSSIDQPSAPDTGVELQIVSYGYAHWNLQEIPPGATGVPALNAENDLGWRQRIALSKIRPIPGLPYGDTWQFPDDDDPGLAGPWALDTFEDQATGVVIPQPRPPIDPAVAAVLVPLYDTVFRLNTRDGVWYAGDGLGDPLDWDETSQTWKPAVPAAP